MKKYLIVFILLFLTFSNSYATRYVYENVVQDSRGNIVENASITVYLAGTTTEATIYTAVSGGAADSDSIIATGDDGTFLFYVDEADYSHIQRFKYTVSVSGYSAETWDYIQIFPDLKRTIVAKATTDQADADIPGTIAWHISDATAGETIYILPGISYIQTDTITSTKQIVIKGIGAKPVITQQTTSKGAFLFSGSTASGSEISNLKIVGPQYDDEDSAEQAVKFLGDDGDNPITDVKAYDLDIEEWGYSGIVMGNWCERYVVDNNYIKNIWKHGIIARSGHYGEITRNKILNILADSTVGTDTAYGISLSTSYEDNASYLPSSYNIVSNNLVNGCIHEAIGSHYGNHNQFLDNRIVNSLSGIAVQSSAAGTYLIDHTIVANNVIERGSLWSATQIQRGIYVKGSNNGDLATNVVIEGNTVDGFGDQDEVLGTTPSAAFEVRLLYGPTIFGNTIRNSGRIGMHYRSVKALNAFGNVIDTVSGTGPVAATGTITFADNPSNSDTITINGAVYTFVDPAAPSTDYEIDIKGSLALTLDEIIAVLNAATGAVDSYPTDGRVSTATYTENGVDTLTITYDYPGRNGNYFTLAASSDTPSGANLTGGEVGSSGIVIEKLSGLQEPTGKISGDTITLTAGYAGVITEPDTDILNMHFDNLQIISAACDYDFGGSSGTSPNEAAGRIMRMQTASITYDLPSIAADNSYTFYVPYDGMNQRGTFEIAPSRGNLGLSYNVRGGNNYIEVNVWNFSGGAINAGSQTIYITPSMYLPNS